MRTIEIDDEVFAYLQKVAIPFVETMPYMTIRRLFKLNGEVTSPHDAKMEKGRKQPKTSLPDLVRCNVLKEGQPLFLRDYQKKRIEGYEATISGKELLWKGEPLSMSDLAKKGLKDAGFSSNSVRGPAHWYNSDGNSVKELWDLYLSTRRA